MSYITKFYYIFEKSELIEYLKESWEKKPDFGWVGGLVSFFTIFTIMPSMDVAKDYPIIYPLSIIGLLFFGLYTSYNGYRFVKNFEYLDVRNGFKELIKGLDEVDGTKDEIVFHAGTKKTDGKILSSAGRVLGVTSLGNDIKSAIDNTYAALDKISFESMFFRRDIGQKALKKVFSD